MRIKRRLLVLVSTVALLAAGCVAAQAASASTVAYTGSDEVIANPERGFMHYADCSSTPLSAATLASWRSEGITQVFCMVYLREFRTRDLDEAELALLQQQFATVRQAGLTVILRFAYTDSEAGDDAAPAQVLRHIAQLKPLLQANAYVITTLQAGFVGAWGEWYYTQNFKSQDDRKAVVDALLDALPATRTVQLRTPAFKRSYYGTEPGAQDRVGHHNDCFLASADDLGTYADPAVERPYLAADSVNVPVGGETCAVNAPRSECASAVAEMAQFRWSYANADYQPDVLASWKSGGCLPEIQRRLGYRFTLTDGTFDGTADGAHVRIGVRNDGFAAPFNPRLVQLVARDAAGALHRLPLTADPRRWAAGTTTTIEQDVTLPAGTYHLGLALPDATPALASVPDYAIRTANVDTWVADGGYNDLGADVTVG